MTKKTTPSPSTHELSIGRSGKNRRGQVKRARHMTLAAYSVVAEAVRSIEDVSVRKTVADHFATFFNRRSTSFEVIQWERATGGRPAPDSAKT